MAVRKKAKSYTGRTQTGTKTSQSAARTQKASASRTAAGTQTGRTGRTQSVAEARAQAEAELKTREKVSKVSRIAIGAVLAILLELSNLGVFGTVGGWLKYAQTGLFGALAYVFPIILLAGFIYSAVSEKSKAAPAFAVIFLVWLCTLVHLLSDISLTQPITDYFNIGVNECRGGGIIGGTLAAGLSLAVSKAGAVILAVLFMLFCLFMIFRRTIVEAFSGEPGSSKKRVNAVSGGQIQENAGASQMRSRQAAYRQMSTDDIDSENGQGAPYSYRKKERTVYETEDEDGKVVRIVKTTAKRRKVKRAQMLRSRNKATPLRDGSVEMLRSDNKAKGVITNTAVVAGNAGGDEVHEITNARPKVVKKQVEEIVTPTISIKDVTTETTVTEVRPARHTAAKAEQSQTPVPAKEDIPAKAAPEIKISDAPTAKQTAAQSAANASIFAESNKDRASLSGKTFSHGEPERTFKPVTTTRGEAEQQLPPMNLLSRKKAAGPGEDGVENMAATLEKVLYTFGVTAKVVDTQVGPSVTRFELQPEMGTRVSKITQLADDLKLNLAVTEIRIEAPIPGKSAVGIEVPNKSRQTVTLRELLESQELINHKSKIAFSAGKDISGNVIVSDLAKMPHLLVAGTTGSGKSVFLNSILMCILYRSKPSEVGLIIIDPKKVEFSVYAGIPNLVKEVVSDPGQAVSTLRWAVAEMTTRYQRMQLSGVRDFTTYNAKFDRGELSEEEENPRRMPQIVIVIDELADLMMVAAKEVESLICRLAQLARAAGIHLIIATQRPSVDVVTGLIKANIPARAALLVASGVDSRTIIDMVGAEKLLGNGDMLFYPTGYVKPVRVQGAYVSDKEIQDTVAYLVNNKTEDFYAVEAQNMEKYMSGDDTAAGSDGDEDEGSRYDEHFHDAVLMCIENSKASSSMIQRRFNVGFNRAARIIDQMYEFGVVGPANGAKPRELLMDSITFEDKYNEMMGR